MYTEEEIWMVRWDETPLGHLDLFFSDQGLAVLEIRDPEDDVFPVIPGLIHSNLEGEPPAKVIDWVNNALGDLLRYFNGAATAFSDIPLDLKGTPFQLQVWEALRQIPSGKTISYQELARRLGRPRAARAVGQACGANPIPLIIPCHRVIASNGSLGGFSSGLAHKRWLLEHEQRHRGKA